MTYAPQVSLIVLFAMGIGIHMAKHGEPRTDRFNVFTALIVCAIEVAILWWGGFWT